MLLHVGENSEAGVLRSILIPTIEARDYDRVFEFTELERRLGIDHEKLVGIVWRLNRQIERIYGVSFSLISGVGYRLAKADDLMDMVDMRRRKLHRQAKRGRRIAGIALQHNLDESQRAKALLSQAHFGVVAAATDARSFGDADKLRKVVGLSFPDPRLLGSESVKQTT
jgi:hypothetical protein